MAQTGKVFFPAATLLDQLLGRMGYVDPKRERDEGLPPPHPLSTHVARMCVVMYRICTQLHVYTISKDEKKDKYPWIFPLDICDIVCEYLIRDSPQMGLSSRHIARCLRNGVMENDPRSLAVTFIYGSSVLHQLLLLPRRGNKDPFFLGRKGNWIPSDTDIRVSSRESLQHDQDVFVKTVESGKFFESLFPGGFKLKDTKTEVFRQPYILKVNILSGKRKIFSH
jgi:hypothetical protein